MTIFYEEWQQKECGCDSCQWRGTAGAATRGSLHRGLYLDLYCPECTEPIDIIIFPAGGTCSHKVEEMTEERKREYEESCRAEEAYRAQCLKSPDQLPDLQGEALTMAWDQVEGDTLILCGETVLWSEPVAYEAFERFERIAIILKEKYGSRVKDLVPTDRSLMFLYGDYYPSVSYVGKVRREQFGAEAASPP